MKVIQLVLGFSLSLGIPTAFAQTTNCRPLPTGGYQCDNGLRATPLPNGGLLYNDGTRSRPLPGGGVEFDYGNRIREPVPAPGRNCIKDVFGRNLSCL
jgi:hypothetical protein